MKGTASCRFIQVISGSSGPLGASCKVARISTEVMSSSSGAPTFAKVRSARVFKGDAERTLEKS